jgi:hypothetical protein
MHDKKAAAAHREISIGMGFSSPPDQAEKKYGSYIPQKKRDFMRIIGLVNRAMVDADPTLPKDISAAHYAVIAKILQIALRDNNALGQAYCPKCKTGITPICTCPTCKTPVEIKIPIDKLEKNSTSCLETMLDRFAPKLQSQTTNINIQSTIVNLTGGLAQIITEFVSPEKRLECGIKIRSLIASYQNAVGTEITPC